VTAVSLLRSVLLAEIVQELQSIHHPLSSQWKKKKTGEGIEREKKEREKDRWHQNCNISCVSVLRFIDNAQHIFGTLAFHHSKKYAITIRLPLTCKDTVQLTLHYKALQGSKKALLSPNCFQGCCGGQKSGCLSLCSVAHSLSKWRQSPSSFPFPHIFPSIFLSLGDCNESVYVFSSARLSKVYRHFGLRYIQDTFLLLTGTVL